MSPFVGRGVSNTRPVMESVPCWFSGEFLLHAPCLNLSGRTSGVKSILHVPFWHLFLLPTVGESLLYAPYRNLFGRKVVGEFLLHAPHWKLSSVWGLPRPLLEFFLAVWRVGSFYHTPRAGICLVVKRIRIVVWGISLTCPVLACLVFGL